MPVLKWTSKRRATFLDALAETGNISHAARAAKASRSRAYQLKAEDPDFAAEWAEALDVATDALDAEARRRAVDGVETPHSCWVCCARSHCPSSAGLSRC